MAIRNSCLIFAKIAMSNKSYSITPWEHLQLYNGKYHAVLIAKHILSDTHELYLARTGLFLPKEIESLEDSRYGNL